MAQPPPGYGWLGQPTAPEFPSMAQYPYAPQPAQYGTPYTQPPGVSPGLGWSFPGQQQPIPFGTNVPYGTPTVQPTAPASGFGFVPFNNNLPQPSANPCQPPVSVSSTVSIPTDPTAPVQAGARVMVITSDREKKPQPPPSPRQLHSSEQSTKSNLVPHSNDSTTNDHRNSSRYQEGLKNMADLMTDVDLTDEVLDTVKSRFGLK